MNIKYKTRDIRDWREQLILYIKLKLNTVSLVPDSQVVNLDFLDPEPLLFYSSSSSVILTWLSGPRSRPTTSRKKWVAPGSAARNSDH
jgi:hypothetical protein